MHESLSQPSDQLSVLCRIICLLKLCLLRQYLSSHSLSGASHSVPLIDSSLNNWFQRKTLSSAFCLGFLIFISHVQAFNSFHTSPWWPFSCQFYSFAGHPHGDIAFSNCTRLESNTISTDHQLLELYNTVQRTISNSLLGQNLTYVEAT